MCGYVNIYGFCSVCEGTFNTERTCCFQSCFVIGAPCDLAGFCCSVCIRSSHTCRKLNVRRSDRCIQMFCHTVACHGSVAAIRSTDGCYGSFTAGQTVGFCFYGKVSGFVCRTYDYQSFSGIGIDVCGSCASEDRSLLIFAYCCLVTVVNTNDLTVAGQSEADVVCCSCVQISVCIGDIYCDVRKTASISGDGFFVFAYSKFCRCIRCGNRSISCKVCDLFAGLIVSFCRNRSLFISYVEYTVQRCGICSGPSCTYAAVIGLCCVGIIFMTCCGCVDFTCCSTDFFAIAVKFHFCSIGVNPYRSFAVLVDHIVAVPCSYKMKGRVILFPLASIQIVSIFWETGCFNDAEVAAVWIRIAAGYGTSAGTVPRSRFTDVVKTGPYTFAGNFIFRYGIPDRVMGCFTPAYFGSIIRCQMEFAVYVLVVCGRNINTAAVGS